MKTKILSGLICCLGIFSANAQTITAPSGQNLTITNPVDVTGAGNSVNIPNDGAYKIGGTSILKIKTSNILIGDNTGTVLTTGAYNFFQGLNSGAANTTGQYNVFSGVNAGVSNVTGSFNNFSGGNAGYFNTGGTGNVFTGTYAGYSNTTGNYNAFLGSNAGFNNIGGSANMFIGPNAGLANTTGDNNICIGSSAGSTNTTGAFNTYIGASSGGTAGLNNATAIGTGAQATISNTVVLGNAATTITGKGLSGPFAAGLQFPNLTASSSATPNGPGGNRVLSVDTQGNVILVALTLVGGAVSQATGASNLQTDAKQAVNNVESNWKEADGYLYNNSTNGVVIKGTGLDGNSLIVKGGVLSKEVNVKVEGSESWPDYVFKPSYKRMTLGEVEKFININGHLPNVPSATEMAKTGNNLGQTDVKLLEKVEELTLYLLEMKKANDTQAAELKALKMQVSKLRKK